MKPKPFKAVVNDPTNLARIIQIANDIEARYAIRRQEQGFVKIKPPKIKCWAIVNQSCSLAWYNRPGIGRCITIAAYNISSPDPGRLEYVIAHELAHHYAHHFDKERGHGKAFNTWLKRLCDPRYVHYILDYRPKGANAVGIRKLENAE